MFKTKKLVTGVVAFSMLFALVASFAAPAAADTMMTTTTTTTSSAAYTFGTNLTIGSTGPDVVALQTVLVAKGFLVMPSGVAMGYFGSITKTALARMQAAVGISPASGYFGPISRAYFAAHPELSGGTMTTTTPGCAVGAMYNSMTGAPCGTTTTTTPTTCPAGYTCVPAGGTTGGTTNTTSEGTLTVYQGTVGSNGNIQTNTDVPVYSLQLRAQQGNVKVDRIDLQVIDTLVGGNTENPANFINNVKVMDADTNTTLVNRNVSISDFVTGTSSTTYYLRLSGLGFNIPAGSTKNLTVTFSTSGSIDTQRNIVIRGYGAASLLAYSGVNNTASYYDISGLQTTQTFTKPGNTTVVIGVDQSNPLSMTNYVDTLSGAQKVTMLAFNTNTTSGSSQLNQVVATVNATGTAPTAVYLYQGANIISSRGTNGLNSTVTFDNLPTTNTTGNTVYTIKADFPAGTATGTTARVNVTSANFINTNGNNQTSNQVVTGNVQYFYPVTANLAFVSASATPTNNNNGNTSSVAVTFNFTMTPYPGSAVQPTAADFMIARVNGATGIATTTGSSTGTTVNTSKVLQITPTPTNSQLGAGQAYTLQLTANDTAPTPGAYYYIITTASTTVKDSNGNNVTVVRTWGFDNFKTNNVVTQ